MQSIQQTSEAKEQMDEIIAKEEIVKIYRDGTLAEVVVVNKLRYLLSDVESLRLEIDDSIGLLEAYQIDNAIRKVIDEIRSYNKPLVTMHSDNPYVKRVIEISDKWRLI